MEKAKILVVGATGQVGTALVKELRQSHDPNDIIAADVHPPRESHSSFLYLDVLDKDLYEQAIISQEVTQVYALAAMLSASGERHPEQAWELNMQGLINTLELAKAYKLKVFWPSSIAVFGPGIKKLFCPQDAPVMPTTVYGISKVAGELWCKYYFDKFGVDVRSVRYSGLISYDAPPGGGTTDYAVDIFQHAIKFGSYQCFLSEDTKLPMMYMDDAVRATLEIMEASMESIKIRTSYNIAGVSFSPGELAAAIREHIPNFTMQCCPDYRQRIAETWPRSIDESCAFIDWGWQSEYDLKRITEAMIGHLKNVLSPANIL